MLACTLLVQNNKCSNVQWSPPAVGYLKVNVDGASRGSLCQASCGGVLRDKMGKWIALFSEPLATMLI
ncbi:hypothetical protein Gotur_023142 [Gossypium turneri]